VAGLEIDLVPVMTGRAGGVRDSPRAATATVGFCAGGRRVGHGDVTGARLAYWLRFCVGSTPFLEGDAVVILYGENVGAVGQC
jgi:hypothetical protein